jgi:hypothetical protein
MKIIENSYLTLFSKKEMEDCEQKKTMRKLKIKEQGGNPVPDTFQLILPID